MLKSAFIACAMALSAGLAHAAEVAAPTIENINDIEIDGKKYTPKQYVDAFCQKPDADQDLNCVWASKEAVKRMSDYRKVDW